MFFFKNNKLLFGLSLLTLVLFIKPLLNIQKDFSYRAWFKENDEYLDIYDEYEREFGNEDFLSVILHNPQGLINKENLSFIHQLSKKLYQIHNIIKVDSITDYDLVKGAGDNINIEPLVSIEEIENLNQEKINYIKKESNTNNLLRKYLINPSGTTAVIFMRLKPVFDKDHGYDITYSETKELMAKENLPIGTIYHLSGGVSVVHAISTEVNKDMGIITPVLLIFVMITILYLYRSLWITFTPLILIITTLLVSFSLASLMGVTFNVITSMAPHILIAICISDSIHVISGYFTFFQEFHDKKTALIKTIEKNLKPTFLTSFTTSIGFWSLTWTEIKPIFQLGMVVGLGTILAWLFTFTILPFFLYRIPLKENTIHKNKLKGMFSQNYIQWVYKKCHWVILISIAFSVIGAMMARNSKVNSYTVNLLHEQHPVRIANELMREEFGGFSGIDIIIQKDPGGLPQMFRNAIKIQKWVEAQPWSAKTVSMADMIMQLNRAVREGKQSEHRIPDKENEVAELIFLHEVMSASSNTFWITPDKAKTRVNVLWYTNGSVNGNKYIAEIEKQMQDYGIKGYVAGKSYLLKGINGYLVEVFMRSMIVAVILVFIIMLLTVKSFNLALLSMIPNVVPIMMGLGIMNFLNIDIDFSVVMVASVCLGIAIDDTIHFLNSYFLYQKESMHTRIYKVLNSTGVALISTTFILMISFSTFLLGNLKVNDNFGMLTMIIMFLALACDLIVLPAVLFQFDKFKKRSASKA